MKLSLAPHIFAQNYSHLLSGDLANNSFRFQPKKACGKKFKSRFPIETHLRKSPEDPVDQAKKLYMQS